MSNVASLFFDAARRNPGGAAFVRADGASLTFRDLRHRVERFAGGLASVGFGAGDRAVFMLPMSPELYVSVLGALTVGGVAVFVDPWIPLPRIAALAAAARARAFVGSPRAHLLRLLAPALREIPLTIVSGPVARPFARHRLAAMRGDARIATVSPDASALVTYTTGSSGAAKGVNRTHAILGAQHQVIRREFPVIAGDVDLTTFPVFALSNLAAGITTVIPPVDLRRVASASGARVLGVIRACGVTTVAASPPLFDVLARHIAARGVAAAPLRRIVSGGAPVRDDQLRRWRATWPSAEIVVAYGSSEAEPVASIGADERIALAGRPGGGYCVGRPVHAVQVRLIPIEKGPVSELRALPITSGVMGELVVTGPHVCRDYVGDARAFAEGKVEDAGGTVWHRMGDTGYFDAEGRFWLVGRVHSTIVRDGVAIHPQVIEQAARGDDAGIRAVAAVGMPDDALGERVVLVVESEALHVGSVVRERLAEAKLAPVDALVVTRKPLPVDPRHNSKVDYQRLRDLLRTGALE
jgi:acyl-CoA synthetase (AMP-forming)/AMP-acid ligase II